MKQSFLLRFVVLVTAMMCALGASAAEAYACYTSADSTLTFYYDNQRGNRTGTTYDLNEETNYPNWVRNSTTQYSRVVFDSSFAAARPTSTFGWFFGMENLKTIIGMNYLNTSEVTNMTYMFDKCSSLKSLNVSFNMSKVHSLTGMFEDCSSLESLDLSGWNTSKVTDMSEMFSFCRSLKSLNVGGWNTANVLFMESMFQGCESLQELNLRHFNTSKVKDMSYMFNGCSSLITIYAGSGWSTAAVTNTNTMFNNCFNLVGGQGTTYDVNHTGKEYAHIDGGPSNPGYFTDPNAPLAYACYTPSNTTLTFYYDTQRSSRSGTTYSLAPGATTPGWVSDRTNLDVTRVVFDSSFDAARPLSTYHWFYEMNYLESVDGMEYLNTSNVTNMAGMFYDCHNLRDLDVSRWNTAKVTDMGGLFELCSDLRSLDVDNWNTSNVTNMKSMFAVCSNLRSLNLTRWNTEKVTDMEYMFFNCDALHTINVHNGWSTAAVTKSTGMFIDCTSLVGARGSTYDASHTDKSYARIDGGPGGPGYFNHGYDFEVNGIYYSKTNSLILNVVSGRYNCYDGIVKIPPTVNLGGITHVVEGIGPDAFYNCTDLDSVSIPGTVTSIGHHAFYNCSLLEHVTLSKWLTTIGDDAFHLCWNLRDITIPDNVEYIGVGAFMECSNLASVVIGNSVTTIGQNAFDHCTSLTGVVIPNSVTTIGKKAFYGCSNLENAVIGSGVTSIGSQAFYSCTNLRNITCKGTTPPTMAASDVFDNSAYTYATLFVPNGSLSAYQSADWWRNFTTISDQKFYDFAVNGIYYLITSGNTVEVSFRDAGLNTYSGNVTVPETVPYGGVTYQVTGIGTGAFANCANLTGVTLPSTVTYISDFAFMSCPSLGSVTLPNSLLTIGQRAFRDCTGLTSVTIPNSVTTIGSSVTFIGSYAFDDCDALRDVTCLASTPPVMENAGVFDDDTYAYGTLTIPEASQSAYRSANWWKNFTSFTTFVPEAYACYTPENTTLTFYYDNQRSNRPGTVYGLTLPDDSLWPGWYFDYDTQAAVTRVVFDQTFSNVRPQTTYAWFSGMSNLTTITGMKEYLNTSEVTNMNIMFSGCSSLTSLDVSGFNTSNVEYMASMFAFCSSLTNLDLSSFNTSNVSFMSYMFSYCRKLQSVNLSSFNTSNVVEMGGMFTECNKLSSVDLTGFNTSNVTNMHGLFLFCYDLTSVDLSSFNTSKVTDMVDMFGACSGLTTIYVGEEWSTSAVTPSTSMFYGCTSLVGGMGTTFDANYVDAAYAHIDGGPSNPGYFTAKGGAFLRGDVNGDSNVTISDVTALIDLLLGGGTINNPAADCNGDTNVTISDVTALIDYLLGGTW